MEETQYFRIAKALADPTRHEILQIIARRRELFCGEIKECFSVAQPTISHHLRELASAGLVTDRREGQHIYYRFRHEVLAAYVTELQHRTGLSSPRPPNFADNHL